MENVAGEQDPVIYYYSVILELVPLRGSFQNFCPSILHDEFE